VSSTDAPTRDSASVPRRLVGLVVRAGRGGWRRLRDWNHSEGAESSGLAALVETHALQAMGDATITVALAGSLFFSVPTHEARSRVALYLLVTMAPFAVVAPILGPLLDKFRRGRRTALALTMVARAVLAIVISHGLTHSAPLTLYPAALGILVAGKAYSIARSAALPRLVPEGMTLVQANARITITGVVAPGFAAAIAVGVIKLLGHRTELELGAVVYCLAALLASRLPAQADGGRDQVAEEPTHGGLVRTGRIPAEVSKALRTAVVLRWLSGFLLLFGAFVVRVHPLGHLSANVSLAELAVGIGIGNVLGTTIGPRTASVAARWLSVTLLAATTAVSALAAVDFGLFTMFAIAVVGSASQAVAKLSLDATIQRSVEESRRTSVFARSETTLQLAWVVGGGIGILLPTSPLIGFTIATAVLGLGLATALGLEPLTRHRSAGRKKPA
jgi:MFS family permease